jgi:IclR family acetate operon transcriptional repressor
MTGKTEKKPLIQVLEKALDMMEFLARENRPLRATDIAENMGLSLSRAHNLIRSLYGRGYLSQDQNRMYSLGPQCFYLGSFADKWGPLRTAAEPVIKELSEKTGDLSFLGVIENRRLFCVSLAQGTGAVTVSPPQTWAEELHSNASGKVLLAALGKKELRAIISCLRLRARAGKTITDPETLIRDCEKTAARGFGLTKDEAKDGVAALAAPVRDKDGRIIAALGQSFPSFYLDNGKITAENRAALLKACAERITDKI